MSKKTLFKTVEDAEKYLQHTGFDGLYYPGECACKLGDLCPCGESPEDCLPGYSRVPTEEEESEYDFIVGPDKK
jgi:hypothetical protein